MAIIFYEIDTLHAHADRSAVPSRHHRKISFEQLIQFLPVPDLTDGEHLTKEHFARDFKRSYLYRMLTNREEAVLDDQVNYTGAGREAYLSENNHTQLPGEFYFHLF